MAVTYEDVKTLAKELYDVESRPEKVKVALTKVGLVTALSKMGMNGSADKVVDVVAAMTTVAGLKEKKDAAMEIAAPYIAKAKDAEGRAELYEEFKSSETFATGKAKLNEKVVEPVTTKINAGKEFAAPYVASAKEYVDPYVAKLTELRNSERVESMITAFNQVRNKFCPPPPYLPATLTRRAAIAHRRMAYHTPYLRGCCQAAPNAAVPLIRCPSPCALEPAPLARPRRLAVVLPAVAPLGALAFGGACVRRRASTRRRRWPSCARRRST